MEVSVALTKVCNVCAKEMPILKFNKHKTTADRRQNQCRDCRNTVGRIYRERVGNGSTHKYEKSKKGFLVRTYRNMKSRVEGVLKQKAHLYKGLQILDKETFYSWALSDTAFNNLFDQWEGTGYDKRFSPSIDRKESDKGYILSNMQWLTQLENSKKGNASRWNNM